MLINHNFKMLDLCWIHSGRAFKTVKWLLINLMPSVSLKSVYNFTSALKKPQNFSFGKFVLSSFIALCSNDVITFLFLCHYTVITVPYINQMHAYLLKICGVIIWQANILIQSCKKQRACITVYFISIRKSFIRYSFWTCL